MPLFRRMERIQVPVNGADVHSVMILEAGVDYRLRATGTARTGPPEPGQADAEYAASTRPRTPAGRRRHRTSGSRWTRPGRAFQDAALGPYNPSHLYISPFTGRGATITLWFNDCDYSDNAAGFLTVEVFAPCTPVGPG